MNNSSILSGQKTEYPFIDILKFIGALLVVAIHTAPFHDINSLLNHGVNNLIARIAVPLFFISNGYFLFKKTSFYEFNFAIPFNYCKKVLRLYVIWTLIYLPLIIRWILTQNSFIPFLQNLIFSGTYDHLWYLGGTVVGILLLSLLIKCKIKMKTTIAISLVLYSFGLILQTYGSLFNMILPFNVNNIFSPILDLIITPRNGILFAFPFILLGALFAFKNITIKPLFAITGLSISFGLLLLEAFVVQYLHWAKDYNMYIFLIPATFFIFFFGLNIKLKPHIIYHNLRVTGILIYFIHPIFIFILGGVQNSLIKYILVVVFSITFAEGIYFLKRFKPFNWLSKLYS